MMIGIDRPLIILKLAFIAIIAIAIVVRLYDLPRGDVVSDEVFYGFRAIGYLDFDFALRQPTTLQLLDVGLTQVPWWTKLSFHDHPPLVFLVQHLSMKFLGVNLWSLRLPSAIFGFLSILLIFMIARKLFSVQVGVIASAATAVNVLMLYISRTAMQEAQVLFFILLTVWLFLKAQDNPRWYLWCGASFGLALLSKFTAIFLFAPLVLYLIFFSRAHLRSVWLYVGAFVGLVVFSPVLIYNLMLYKTFGHFDFQLSYLFGQYVPYWQDTPGKRIGSLVTRIKDLPLNMWRYGSYLFSMVALVAVVSTVYDFIKEKSTRDKPRTFLLLMVASLLMLFLVIGPSPRFVTLLVPWLAVCIAVAYMALYKQMRRPGRVILFLALVFILSWETLYAVNSLIVYRPYGKEVLAYSLIHWDVHSWGFNELTTYLDAVYYGKYPEATVPYSHQFLEDMRDRAIAKAQQNGLQPIRLLTIYNGNVNGLPALWVFMRRGLYEGWPVITAARYLTMLEEGGENFFKDAGFTDIYFIQHTQQVLLQPGIQSEAGNKLEQELHSQGVAPDIIYNRQGQEAFKVYHFN